MKLVLRLLCDFKRAASLLLLGTAVVWVGGCGSAGPKQSAAPEVNVGDVRSGMVAPQGAGAEAAGVPGRGAADNARPIAEIVRDRLTGTNNGLEVRRWTVLDGSSRALGIVAEFAEGSPADEHASERLKRNGLRLARVPADQLETIVGLLGGATMDRNEWHGQVYEWRSLRDLPIDSRGTAIAIDGRVRRFERGEFRLLIRSWTIMMEDGPHFHLEIRPQHDLPRSNSIQRALGLGEVNSGEPFASVSLNLKMQAGYAYVLVSESPNVDWPQFDRPAPVVRALPSSLRSTASAASADANPVASQQPGSTQQPADSARARVGPDDMIGPGAGAPRTLGEVLLPSHTNPPMREIIVFVPKIPDELFPPIYESDLSVAGGGRR